MLGYSSSLTRVDNHGGLGSNPIYRVTVRVSDKQRPWARIQSLLVEPEQHHCVDIMTTSGRVYLPETDTVVRQCDDATILFCSLLKCVGFHTRARVISVSSDPENWVHVYPVVGLPKDDPTYWMPLDMTVDGYRPDDQYPDIGRALDFPM